MVRKVNLKKIVKPEGTVRPTMAGWKMSKKSTHSGSSTQGNLKNTCKADAMQRFFAKSARAYKKEGYSDWCKKMDKLNGIIR